MNSKKEKDEWLPQLMYQEGAKLPFIDIPPDQEVDRIFVWLFQQTGKFEPGMDGEEIPTFETDLGLFFSYKKAKELLSPELFDELRIGFGLDPLEDAIKKGEVIIDKAAEKVVESVKIRKPATSN